MRFYKKTQVRDRGNGYLKKSFAWLPTDVNGVTVWLEYYWHYMYWSYSEPKYKRTRLMTEQNKLIEEHNEHS